MRSWLRHGRRALAVAADRADLWPAGTIAWLAFAGWLPLLLALAPPTGDGVEQLGVSLYVSGAFPWNVVALTVGAVAVFAALCALAAGSEVALQRMATGGSVRGLARTTLTAFSILLLAALPVVAVAAAALIGAVAFAQAEYLAPGAASPVLLRIAGHVVPQLVLTALVLVLMQAFGAVALRRAAAGDDVMPALAGAIRELRHRPLRHFATTLVVLVVDTAIIVLQVGLLRVLWAPIGVALGNDRLGSPDSLLLLLGFVAIWLGLLLAAGATHVAASAWRSLEAESAAGPGMTGMPLPPPLAGRPLGNETGGRP